jgi:hypothetical protein
MSKATVESTLRSGRLAALSRAMVPNYQGYNTKNSWGIVPKVAGLQYHNLQGYTAGYDAGYLSPFLQIQMHLWLVIECQM